MWIARGQEELVGPWWVVLIWHGCQDLIGEGTPNQEIRRCFMG